MKPRILNEIKDQPIYLTIKAGISVCLSVCMYVCLLRISKTVHPIDFTLGGCIAGDPRTCSVEFGALWTFRINKLNKQTASHSAPCLSAAGTV